MADGASESSATGTPWLLGVRARLLFAFFGISAFAALAAAAGIYAFREVGGRLDIVETRVAPTVSSLELSHSAERIIATAPALLAAADRTRRDEIKAGLEAELAQLNAKLLDLKRSGAAALPLQEIEPVVASLTSNLAALEDLVARRLEASERITVLRRSVFQTSDETQRLLAPWLEVMDKQISSLVQDLHNARAATGPDGPERLAVLIELQRQTQAGQRQVPRQWTCSPRRRPPSRCGACRCLPSSSGSLCATLLRPPPASIRSCARRSWSRSASCVSSAPGRRPSRKRARRSWLSSRQASGDWLRVRAYPHS